MVEGEAEKSGEPRKIELRTGAEKAPRALAPNPALVRDEAGTGSQGNHRGEVTSHWLNRHLLIQRQGQLSG